MASSEISCPATAAMPLAVPSLRITFTWTLVGNVVYALCQWDMISSLAKLGTTAAVGQFALALAITAPVFMLTNLQLRGIRTTLGVTVSSRTRFATTRARSRGGAD
jgi:hypothetical protein